ncbi:MAG: ATP-binding protein [Ekhidna sp.]
MHHHFLACLLFLLVPLIGTPNSSWDQAAKTKSASLNLHWYTSKPFIYEGSDGNLAGIEFEIVTLFRQFVKEKHGIDLELNWINASNFGSILEQGLDTLNNNSLGVSALSITDARLKKYRFSKSYLQDVTVLVSSKGTPIVSSFAQMNDMMKKMDAVTVEKSKYEKFLDDIKNQMNVDFDINYIDSEQNILEEINNYENKFAFIDLPVYLMLIESGGEVTRQNFFTVKGQGYVFLAPINSDWIDPFNDFMDQRSREIDMIISSYLGDELHDFIKNLDAGDGLDDSILTKEKELQKALSTNENLSLEKRKLINNVLIIGVLGGLFILAILGFLFYKRNKSSKVLLEQQEQIEEREQDIELKNEQLLIRNSQLVLLNEEKNNLLRILAHDLRSPLNQIIGFAGILEETKSKLSKDEKFMIDQVGKSAVHINEMVTKILDVDGVEGSRLKIMRERLDVREIFKEIASRYTAQANNKNINIELVQCDKWFSIWTDHLLLTLSLENLVSNAVKFSPSKTTIRLETQCEYDHVVFKISDQGPGFTEEDKKNIFNRFQRLSAKPTGNETSTGLGLSIVKKYVSDLKGEIWLESEEGKGSTFYIKLSA